MVSHGVDRSGGAGGTGASVSPIDEQLIDAKGDLIAGTAANTAGRLAVGTDTYILSALSTEGTGLIWLSPADVFQDAVDAATAETAPAVGDVILLSDVSLTPDAARKMTLENVLKVVNGLTAATELDGVSDKVAIYDVSASAARQVPAGTFLRKNAVINGDFNVWQRGVSFAAIASDVFAADRWQYATAGAPTVVFTAAQSSDVPTVAEAGRLFNYSLWFDCTTADAAFTAGQVVTFRQSIEGYNWLPLAQRPCTLSFWVKASKTGVYCIALQNTGTDRSYVAEYTVNAASIWEKKTITIPASPAAGTWNYTNGAGVRLYWVLGSGTTFHTTAGSWQTGQFFATANQVNACDNVANDFRIAGVQLEPGSVATDFEQRTFNEELALCERYLQVWGGTTPFECIGSGFLSDTTNGVITLHYSTPMRAAPTMTYSDLSHWRASSNAGSSALSALATGSGTGVKSASLSSTASSGIAPGGGGGFIIEANNTTSARLYMQSEL